MRGPFTKGQSFVETKYSFISNEMNPSNVKRKTRVKPRTSSVRIYQPDFTIWRVKGKKSRLQVEVKSFSKSTYQRNLARSLFQRGLFADYKTAGKYVKKRDKDIEKGVKRGEVFFRAPPRRRAAPTILNRLAA